MASRQDDLLQEFEEFEADLPFYCYVEKVNHLIKITKQQSVMEHALLVFHFLFLTISEKKKGPMSFYKKLKQVFMRGMTWLLV